MVSVEGFRVAVLVPGILSLISAVILLVTHYRLIPRDGQARSNKKLIAYLQMAILGSDLTAIILSHAGDSGHQHIQDICAVYSVFESFFLLSGAIWGSIVARQLQLLVYNRQTLNQALYRLNSYADEDRPFSLKGLSLEKVRMSVFHILAWGLPFLFSGIIALVSVTGEPMSVWCWFETKGNDFDVPTNPSPQMLLFYLPISITLAYNCSVLGSACIKYLRKVCGDGYDERIDDPLEAEISKLARALRWFVLLSSVISFWLCVAELVNVTTRPSDKSSRFCIFLFLVILLRLHGFANLVVYSQGDDVKKCWRDWLARFGIYGDNDTEETEEIEEAGFGETAEEILYEENPLKPYIPPTLK